MGTRLVINVDCDDDEDMDWLRNRCVGAVDDIVVENQEEGRLDGKVEVWWDMEDVLDEDN